MLFYANSGDVGRLILRLSVGGLMFLHGINKIENGIGGIEGAMQGIGLPSFIAYGVYVGEVLAPILLILGVCVRLNALMIIGTMIVAALVVTGGEIFALNQHGGWIIELQGLYLFGALALVFLGSGKFGLYKRF